jgi:ubiquinone/menaquinone biosynthesis C-methylase UbiE
MRTKIAASFALVAVVSLPALPALPAPPAVPALPALPALPAPPAVTAPPAQSAPQKPKARLFPPLDLGLLEGADREQWQKPDQIMDALKIADGSVVADIGAGGGWFTVKLARRVGPTGRVYAEDIQPLMIEALKRRVQRENLTNVRTVLGTTKDSGLPHGLDAILIVGAYHEMEDPVGVLKDAADSLKPQGRLGIVEYTPGAGGPGPEPDQRVAPETVIAGAAAAHLHVIERDTIPPFVFLLVFGKEPVARNAR